MLVLERCDFVMVLSVTYVTFTLQDLKFSDALSILTTCMLNCTDHRKDCCCWRLTNAELLQVLGTLLASCSDKV